MIRNFRFAVGDNEELREIPVEDIPTEIFTNTDFRWFIPIKPNIVNNFYLDSPFGLPSGRGISDKIGNYAAQIADLKSLLDLNLKKCFYELNRLDRYI